MNDVVVLGATGNVGRAVVRELLDRQQPVMAVARNHQRLDALRADMSSSLLASVPVDMSDDRALTQLANDRAVGTPPRAVVVALNSWAEPRPMLEWTAASLLESLHANLVSHLNAARAFLPLLLAPDGVFLSVGGGTADHLVPGSAHSSVTQAALRMMIRAIAAEEAVRGVHVKELLIRATVRGHRETFDSPHSIEAGAVAAHIAAMISAPGEFNGVVHEIR